ncbi:MAG: LytR/AlgR family response regulator transcription factor [Flammeovirgaceae bacterium]
MSSKKTCIIVDDESLARDLICEFISEFKEIEVIAQCAKGKDAVKEINTQQPDLIFLDVQMPDLTGFEVLAQLEHKPCIIFSTAYDKYAIRAFEANAVDYLLKPIDQDRFRIAVNRALEQLEEPQIDMSTLLTSFQAANQTYPNHFIVQKSNKMVNVPVSDIMYFEASGDYTVLHTTSDEYLSSKTLTSWGTLLDPNSFVRIHRSTIINFAHLSEVEKHFKGGLIVTMQNGKQLPVSRTYVSNIKSRLV